MTGIAGIGLVVSLFSRNGTIARDSKARQSFKDDKPAIDNENFRS
jgi:hypothetical protein